MCMVAIIREAFYARYVHRNIVDVSSQVLERRDDSLPSSRLCGIQILLVVEAIGSLLV